MFTARELDRFEARLEAVRVRVTSGEIFDLLIDMKRVCDDVRKLHVDLARAKQATVDMRYSVDLKIEQARKEERDKEQEKLLSERKALKELEDVIRIERAAAEKIKEEGEHALWKAETLRDKQTYLSGFSEGTDWVLETIQSTDQLTPPIKQMLIDLLSELLYDLDFLQDEKLLNDPKFDP